MKEFKGLPIIAFKDLAAWLEWLRVHHETSSGVWAQIAKKGSGIQSTTYEDLREGALLYGWIDGQGNRFDEKTYLQRLTPRRPGSGWSKINRDLAEGFIAEGRMQPAGQAQVDAAKKDGRWERAYASPASIEVPPDLAQALAAHPQAKEAFDQLGKTNRYSFLYRIITAKRPETRARHVQKTIDMLLTGQVHHPKN